MESSFSFAEAKAFWLHPGQRKGIDVLLFVIVNPLKGQIEV